MQNQFRYFYKVNKEAFSTWSVETQKIADHVKSTQARFFENFASQGERLGQLRLDLLELDHDHNLKLEALQKKQQ